MLEARLNGFFAPDHRTAERVNLSRLWERQERPAWLAPPVRIADARPFQAEAASEAEFLDAHGFVLLHAPTVVTDWSDEAALRSVHAAEIEHLIRTRLYPGRQLIVIQGGLPLRRGAGTAMPGYGAGVHCDFDRSAEDYQYNVAAFAGNAMGEQWRAGYEREGVTGFVVLDFWRTTGMAGPLRHMPLALCDARSVEPTDIVPTEMEGIAPGGALTRFSGLRHNPGQAWHYYPGMTGEEVLVFKLIELRRGEAAPESRACFHSAFEDPTAPPDAEPRQSCEHRVSLFLLD